MHDDMTGHTRAGDDAHQRRPRRGAPSWARLHWRDRAALLASDVTRARWATLPPSVRADLIALAHVAYPRDDREPRVWLRSTLRRPVDHLPPDAPRRVLERRDGLVSAARREAAARRTADAGTGYVDAGWWFAGHAEPTQEDHQREADYTAHLHHLSAANVRHARAMYWLTVLILAAVSELFEVRETAPRTGPQRRRAGPPEPTPPQLALTRSTLTAAPPATAPSVPGSRCAVPMAA